MSNRYSHFSASQLEPAEKILKGAIHSWNHPGDERSTEQQARVFITVSRQPGAGAISFSHRLAERLNQDDQKDWSAWDRELVDKVSAETGIARELIEMIPNRRHNWLDDLLQGFSVNQTPQDVMEFRAYKRVVMTIRALAAAGHAIIVGQGGAFITEGMPASIHLRLVAPLEYRIRCTAEFEKLSLHEATARIAEIDQRRSEFFRRYWPNKINAPETFTITLNSGVLSVDEMVECVLPVIRIRQAAGKPLATRDRWN